MLSNANTSIRNGLRWGGFLVLAMLLVSDVASACFAYLSPQARIAISYRADAALVAVLVRVDDAVYVGNQIQDAHPWAATVSVDRPLRGTFSGGDIVLRGGLGSSACDLGYGLPKHGDRWVAYLSSKDGSVRHAFPAHVAYEADPTIK